MWDDETAPQIEISSTTFDCRLTVVGLHGTGKTTSVIKYTTRQYPKHFTPTVYDATVWKIAIDEKNPVIVYMTDTAGGERFDKLRPLYYINSDVFILAVSPHLYTFQEIEEVFLGETAHVCPGVPRILVMMGADRRDGLDSYFQSFYKGYNKYENTPFVDTKTAIEFAQKWKLAGYAECSAKFGIGVDEAYKMAIRIGLKYRKQKNGGSDSGKISKASNKILSFMKSFKKSSNLENVPAIDVIVGNTLPATVYGHGTVLMGNTLYVFGGQDRGENIFSYNLETKIWTSIKSTFQASMKFHSCVTTGSDSNIYVFGGKGNGYSNELLCFNTYNLSEPYKIQATGAPSPRYGQTAVYYEGQIIIFGGYDNNGMACNDLYSYDIENSKWTQIKTKSKPPPDRFVHSAVIHSHAMYIFGGLDNASKPLKDLYKFDFLNLAWEKLSMNGKPPSARYGHSAIVLGNSMYVFGGSGKTQFEVTYSSELFNYNFSSRKWTTEELKGVKARYYHAGVVGEGFFLLGGKGENETALNDIYYLRFHSAFDNSIPDSILLHILSFLPLSNVHKLQFVNKKFYELVNGEEISLRYLNKHYKYHENTIKTMIERKIIPTPMTPLTARQKVSILLSSDNITLSIPPLSSYPPSTNPFV